MTLTKLAGRHNLVLRKGHNASILLRLVLNHVQLLWLHCHKLLHGIHRPIVHYYAVCWNEERMLPWMFAHYSTFVDRFTIYDNYSTDNSETIIKERQDTHIVKFSMNDHIDDSIYQHIKNNCWKRSRGKADYVIVCDMDEFLYHPDMTAWLAQAHNQHITLPTTEGYDMYGDTFPVYDGQHQLTDLIHRGLRSQWFDKCLIFDPHRIVDINYSAGAHHASPTGIVRRSDNPLKVLHYKHLGVDYLMCRYRQLGERLSDYNRKNNYGTHYLAKEEELRAEMEKGLSEAINVIDRQ